MKYKLLFNDSFDSVDEYMLKTWNLDYTEDRRNPEFHAIAYVILTEDQALILRLRFPFQLPLAKIVNENEV